MLRARQTAFEVVRRRAGGQRAGVACGGDDANPIALPSCGRLLKMGPRNPFSSCSSRRPRSREPAKPPRSGCPRGLCVGCSHPMNARTVPGGEGFLEASGRPAKRWTSFSRPAPWAAGMQARRNGPIENRGPAEGGRKAVRPTRILPPSVRIGPASSALKAVRRRDSASRVSRSSPAAA
jgi:hypothetical protein